ncbi:segregation/condensation protein A [Mycoplasmopsis arginini]|uniref:Segregation and condensation protein A n=1 Tax=Mycoplasmopsis arginini TaxID=2094 RepID=A0AA43QX37_MYCAR|nr:segregation/condensation protein A [Mycoplasmopsis arginini]CRH45663.1 Segregation and condensation protein A [Chlamydia trachomatis]ENY69523.1 Segregation and condensation protein A [Mycoplasmopsis arginini 7264]MCY2902791.1 segregation/condensation protein A [Mycoplasmopsis arginini QMP CG1-2758]MDI3348091.1 segregation/condensation protein A [Mycoplasmopsis arginini]MDI3348678.1 segregation/condensation protein A [Mycoplasmopsis arginini]
MSQIVKPVINEISFEEIEKENINLESDKHIFRLSNFDGPLDLLVSLIRDKNISIFEVDLFELATQYLEIIKNIKSYEIDIASEYLVMAATLLQLKARMLLQDPEAEEEIKEEKKRLLEQIAEYEKFKEISAVLREQEEKRQKLFSKTPEETEDFVKEVDSSVLDGHSNSSKLVITLRKMFERTYSELIRNITISTIAVSPEEQKERIIKLFISKNELSFKEIFNVPTIGHFVITLLAVLDLARQQIVILEQDEDEGIIRFKKGIEYEE